MSMREPCQPLGQKKGPKPGFSAKMADGGRGGGTVIHFHWGWQIWPEAAGKAQGFGLLSFFLSQQSPCEA